MSYLEKKYCARLLFVLFSILPMVDFAACGRVDDRSEVAHLSDDEKYLVDSYVKIKLASVDYINQREVAENALARLDSTIDSTRIANTIQTLDETPERWAVVFQEIENALRQAASNKELEQTGGGS